MSTEANTSEKKQWKRGRYYHGSSQAVYGLGMIGAMVYYFTHAATFWVGVIGFFKALVWPAFIIFELMKHLGM